MSFNPILISGKVSELTLHRGKMNLARSQTTDAAAVGAAAAGEFFTSSVLASGSLYTTEGVYFSFKIGETQISGSFLGLGIQEGDEVDVVVTLNPKNEREAFAYVVRLPSHRKIWTAFGYSHSDVRRMITHFPIAIVAFCLPIIALFFIGFVYWEDGNLDFISEAWTILLPTLFGSGLMVYLLLVLGGYIMFTPKAKKAAKIFEALGYKKPHEVVLAEDSHQYKQKWEKENGKPFPDDGDEFVLYY